MKKNYKRVILYITYIIIFYILLYIAAYYLYFSQLISKATFERNLALIYGAIYPIFLGIIVGLPNIIKQFRIKGKWTVDWIKLIIVAIPTLYINFSLLIFYNIDGKLSVLLYPEFMNYLFAYNDAPRVLSGFIFGYILLNSFKKKETLSESVKF